ncbi:MAG: deoxyribodipyrimidine photo-lyase [Candidatus Thermoplasmatota archaeon]|nr:deoxyribodipyrimidine photo-lyase [Candidatus Thermoplasmatota archaeon]
MRSEKVKKVNDAGDIREERITTLNDEEVKDGNYVLYWMQRAQRAEYNHALKYVVEKANELDEPLLVYFGITDDFKEGNLRHYRFMLEGLKETKKKLKERDIKLVIRHEHPKEGVIELADEASLLVVDKAYLDFLRDWREDAAEEVNVPVVEVETDLVVPVEEASSKEEYAARTIRPKIEDELDKYMKEVKKRELENSSLEFDFDTFDIDDLDSALSSLDIDESVKAVESFEGGTAEAKKHLEEFLNHKLGGYGDHSNDPSKDYLSNMSPYLHFGQISPLYVALKAKEKGGPGVDEFLEQLIIRRELAYNFVYYSEDYRSLACLPDWAQETLEKHSDDEREYVYSREEFEEAETHDKYWNSAQKEMVETGKMHGYMRMYWGKKILEWSETPEEAYETALYLNNKYELDGRDPNGFAGVAWCFGKHDQGWKEREVYGKVRYMNANGLERKFDIDSYVKLVEYL